MKRELPACPVETTLMLISDRWKVLIIRDLMDGTKPVSYTHLTLPTNREVEISVGGGSLKKKKI